MIKVSNLHKYYDQVHVLKGLDLSIKAGEIVSVVGASGAGKTTLLQILGTLDNPSEPAGELIINNTPTRDLSSKKLAQFRNKNIGFIFQFHQLLPEFTALENVCIPGFISGAAKEEVMARAKELLEFLGVSHRQDHKPNQLSGGEQQRVAVARALINNPKLILADEPSGNLDSESAAKLHELFFKLRDTYGQTFVIVTHNEALANMADRKLTMKDGKMLA